MRFMRFDPEDVPPRLSNLVKLARGFYGSEDNPVAALVRGGAEQGVAESTALFGALLTSAMRPGASDWRLGGTARVDPAPLLELLPNYGPHLDTLLRRGDLREDEGTYWLTDVGIVRHCSGLRVGFGSLVDTVAEACVRRPDLRTLALAREWGEPRILIDAILGTFAHEGWLMFREDSPAGRSLYGPAGPTLHRLVERRPQRVTATPSRLAPAQTASA